MSDHATPRSQAMEEDFLRQIYVFADGTLPEHGVGLPPARTDLLQKCFMSKPVSGGTLTPFELEATATALQAKLGNALNYHGLVVYISSSLGFSPTYLFRFVAQT